MRIRTAVIAVTFLASVQACSQGTFSVKRYPFPIPFEEPPLVTMQDRAEAQVEEQKRMLGDPYNGQDVLTVNLSEIPDEAWCYPRNRSTKAIFGKNTAMSRLVGGYSDILRVRMKCNNTIAQCL